jgi:hypothetical protein
MAFVLFAIWALRAATFELCFVGPACTKSFTLRIHVEVAEYTVNDSDLAVVEVTSATMIVTSRFPGLVRCDMYDKSRNRIKKWVIVVLPPRTMLDTICVLVDMASLYICLLALAKSMWRLGVMLAMLASGTAPRRRRGMLIA